MAKKTNGRSMRFHVLYHFVTAPLAIVVFVYSIVNWVESFRGGENMTSALLLLLFSLCLVCTVTVVRRYATKTQDRIIRMEEQFRYYRLTGEELSPELSSAQNIALRNAGDDEFPALCRRAITENLNKSEIWSSIQKWRSDTKRI